jgi:exodeoxyribonuclease-3
MTYSIISWNINGIRSKSMNLYIKKQWNPESHLAMMLDKYDPDIVAFNETKCSDEHTVIFDNESALSDYKKYWNCSTAKKGYSGTAIFTKKEPLRVIYGLSSLDEPDTEGRAISLEFESFFVCATYVPNSGRSEEREAYRANIWDKALLAHVKKLEASKPVCLVGDMNVISDPTIDLHKLPPKPVPGCLPAEMKNFQDYLGNGQIDCFRHLHPDKRDAYTWWDYRSGARKKNKGWRIDYALVSDCMREKIKECEILDDVYGSDHCPVRVCLDC